MDENDSGNANDVPEEIGVSSSAPAELQDSGAQKDGDQTGSGELEPAHREHEAPTKSLMRRLTLNEWLTFLVGFGSLVVSGLTYRNANDTSDIKEAVSGLANLARQTKRQADIQNGQLSLLKDQRVAVFRQADAAADSAAAAKDTAATAKGQTAAIVEQAHSLIQSAQATMKAAEAQLASAQANIRTAQAGLEAAEKQRASAELFASTRAPAAKLTGVDIAGWTAAPDKAGIVDVKIKPTYTNVGGGTMIPSMTTFNILVGTVLPAVPSAVSQQQFGGNDLSVAPNSTFSPTKELEYGFSKSDVDMASSNQKFIMVWGIVTFRNPTGNAYKSCYLDIVRPPSVNDAAGQVTPVRASPAYQCEAK